MHAVFPSSGGNCGFAKLIRSFSIIGLAMFHAIEGFIVYNLYAVLLPYYQHEKSYSILAIIVIFIEAPIAILTIFNYWQAACRSPGYSHEYRDVLVERFSSRDETQSRFCEACQLPKPVNVHHCSICEKCIVCLDHHCPWIMNCVGYKNMKFFLLFITYAFLGCLLHTFVSIPPVFDGEFQKKPEYGNLFIASFVGFCLSMALLFFNIWSWGMVLSGNSVITMLKTEGRVSLRGFLSKFTKKNLLNNMEVHFQTRNILAALLPTFKRPTEDPFVEYYNDLESSRNIEVLPLEEKQEDVFQISNEDEEQE